MARLIGKRIYIRRLSWVTTRQVDLCPTCQNFESLYRGLNSHSQSRWSQWHIALLSPCSWNGSHCGNSGQNVHPKDRGGWGASDCLGQLAVQLLVTSSPWPPPTVICVINVYTLNNYILFRLKRRILMLTYKDWYSVYNLITKMILFLYLIDL